MASSTAGAEGEQWLPDAGFPVDGQACAAARTRPPLAPSASTAESVVTAAALLLCVVARVPHHLLQAAGIEGPWALALVVAVATMSGARGLARAPFTLRHVRDSAPEGTGVPRRWAGAEAKVFVVSIGVGTVVSLPLYWLLRATDLWWIFAWLMFAAATVVSQLAMPLALRAKAGVTPAPAPLVERVHRVATRAGVDVGDRVLVAANAGSGRGNAYVVGLGRTRRLVLDQTVAAWPPALFDQVVAHELGHWRLGHGGRRLPLTISLQLATLAAAAAALSFTPLLHGAGLAHIGDPRSYPLLLVVGAGVGLPARCVLAWRDRAQEWAADRFALTLLGRPDDFDAMLRRAAQDSGVPTRLGRWRRLTASHPPIDERAVAHPADRASQPSPIGA